eukprot:UN01584
MVVLMLLPFELIFQFQKSLSFIYLVGGFETRYFLKRASSSTRIQNVKVVHPHFFPRPPSLHLKKKHMHMCPKESFACMTYNKLLY